MTTRDEAAHSLIQEGLRGDEETIVTIAQVQRRVCDVFGVKPSDLNGRIRTKFLAFARHVAMYLARRLTLASLPEIGRAFGGRHYTTAGHAVAKIQALANERPKLRNTIERLAQDIQGRLPGPEPGARTRGRTSHTDRTPHERAEGRT